MTDIRKTLEMDFAYTYTIIIPHKNIPLLLQRCLDSIPSRQDVQIVIVDDNSSPAIVDFDNFPGTTRENTEIVYTTEGKGAGYARNCGLVKARGKWLLFADADDFFLPGFLDVLDMFSPTDYDMIVFRAESMDSDTLRQVASRQEYYDKISENADWEALRYKNGVPWAKMISSDMVRKNRIGFDETPAGNDVMFSAYSDYYAQKVALCSQSIYCATVRENSLYYGVVLENLLARVRVSCRYNRFMQKIGERDRCVDRYYYVQLCRKHFGWKGYLKAMRIYVRMECPDMVYKTFRRLLSAKLKRS